MKKRIYKSMLLLAAITIIATSFLFAVVVYQELFIRVQKEIRNEALYISGGFQQNGEEVFSVFVEEGEHSRITWIARNGTVLFDNMTVAESMENHSDRPEFIQAIRTGKGEAIRSSPTLGPQTFYYAVRLNDDSILRVSATTNSVLKSMIDLIPYSILISIPVIILTMLIANLLTKKIIVPLNSLKLEKPLENEVYDELSPLLNRMAKQNEQIEKQFKELKERQYEFNAITENIGEGIVVLNDKGQILSINKFAAAVFGTESTRTVNKHILTVNRSLTLQKALKSAMEGNSYEDTFTKDNSTFSLLASPVKGAQPIKGVILFILDITEKQTAEKMRREFSANVSHELKTPLTSISGYAELLKNGLVKSEDVPEFSNRIYQEARHLISLVEDIIQISRLDEKNIQLPYEEVDLLEIAKGTAARVAPLAERKQIQLSVRGEKALIYGVRQILEEMIYNLCDNAIKYSRENGTVDVSVGVTEKNITFTVADKGVGIPKEQQLRVFERFYRIDESHSRDTGGTGLGLSIVKHSAEFHNARIQLSSEPGMGTTISVIFKRSR